VSARFRDRGDAGLKLAQALAAYRNRPRLLVLALPRGGVPVAYEVAKALGAPLDLCIVRKLGVPGQPELAMGAIAPGGVRVLDEEVVGLLGIPESVLAAVESKERLELERRIRAYRGGRPLPEVQGRTVLLVDDGVATGSTLRAALQALRAQQPAALVVAVPVAPREAVAWLRGLADDVICLRKPEPFFAIGEWYEDFRQTRDEEVTGLLAKAEAERQGAGSKG
jgi:predicted phosphoribosyltransferase